MKDVFLKIYEVIKVGYDWVAKVTAPMRAWPYGEDGKYIHIMMGIMIGLVFMLQPAGLNILGMIIGGFVIGFLFEKIQEFFFGSLNTWQEQIKDAAWVMVGTTIVGVFAYIAGIARLVY